MTDDKAKSNSLAELRRRAEAKVELDDDLHDMPPSEVRVLVHELRTHQIELEMQNEELCRAQKELSEARDLYFDLYDFAPVGYPTISERGLILQANLTAADVLGAERGKLIKQRFSTFVVAEDEDTFYLHRRDLKRTGQQQSCELRLQRESGEPICVQIVSRFAASTDDPGGLLIRATLSDITKRKQLEEQLRHSQKMEAVGQLAAGVAHEFNNLLFGILGSAEMILATREGELPEYFKRPLRDIKTCGRRGATLTKQLLSFARKKTPDISLFDVNQVVGDLDSVLRQMVGETITLTIDLATDLPTIQADKGEIEQAIVNLARNARDAMPDGGTLTIRTATEQLDGTRTAGNPEARPGVYVELSATDTGCGMSPETMTRIFEPFFTTKPVGQGTGLGLSTVFADVTKSGGIIEVENRQSEGAAFHIYLPSAEKTVAADSDDAARSAGPFPGGSETILVVDDDEFVLDSGAFLLETGGYNVLRALGARKAIETAAAHKDTIDLLLTDVAMPEMNGWELAQKLAEERPGLKVIFMSGYARDVLDAGAAEGEHIEFIGKPPEGDTLLRRIREVLDGTREDS